MGAPSTCTKAGCPDLATHGPRCAQHRHRSRSSQHTRSQRPWLRRSTQYLRRHPRCIDCGAPSRAADHDPYPRRVLVEAGAANPDADHWLKPRCTSHHNQRTAQFERRLTPQQLSALVVRARRHPLIKRR